MIKDMPNYKALLSWAKEKIFTLEKFILIDKARHNLL